MKFAECRCEKCGDILITFKEDYPQFNLLCPLCEKRRVKYGRINGD